MYYVNREQIEIRLQFISVIQEACSELSTVTNLNRVYQFAVERIVQLSIEVITDIGSLLIDGFLMRDASSYEDIIEILHREEVFSSQLAEPLIRLVQLRKTLVQQYYELPNGEMLSFIENIPAYLSDFKQSVEAYVTKELDH